MRNLKKFLALVLAMLMVFSMAVITTSAADEADYSDAAHHLAALKILKGDENGNLNLDNGVTRWQAALFFVQALTGKTDAKVWNADKSVYFTDVPEYGTAIDYAYGISLIVGRGNGTYGYQDAITYQDMLVMAVRALGYETDNMVYPSGYIMAADKLGLTDNIDVAVGFKDALTRGETAQIIWDMLNVYVAYTDPLTGDIIYPQDTGIFETLMNANKGEDDVPFKVTRTTLLEESGFADDTIVGTVVEFVEATEENELEEDMVVVVDDDREYTLVAADLGITADTLPTTYLGLPVTLYIDCTAEDFADKYAEDEATVVFANYEDYTVVENVGDEANIKVVLKNGDPLNNKTAVSLGGTKFEHGKYAVELKTWDDEYGWEDATAEEWTNAFASFVYNKKFIGDVAENPYAENATAFNTYGKVAYRVTDEITEDNKIVVEALYTPYKFGQYNVLEIKDTEYATYTDGFGATMKLFGSDKTVTKTTASVSNVNGAYAKDVTVEGEVDSGDFIFYAYNKADNVLTVVKNCGTYSVGKLTGASTSKDTVRINGTNYGFGFDGLFAANAQTKYADDISDTYIAAYKADKTKNNVKFLAVDGAIVYMTVPAAEEETITGAFDYVIATVDAEIMAELLEIEDVEDYTDALVDGKVYVDEDGYAAIAVLDTATGEWKLASLDTLAVTYNAETKKFTNAVDVVTYAEFKEIGKLSEKVEPKYDAAITALTTGHVYALIAEEDGVYKLGAVTTFGHDVPVNPGTAPADPGEAPAAVANPGDAPAVVTDPGDAPAVVANPGDAPAVVANPGTAPAVVADPGNAPQEVPNPGDAPAVVADPGAAPAVVADPGDAPAVVADPGAAPAVVADPGAAPDATDTTKYPNSESDQAYIADKAAYDTAKAAYDQYLLDKAAYDTAKAAYDQYLLDKLAYDKAYGKYLEYLAAKEVYDEAKAAYDAYVDAKAAYDTEKAAYDQYVADKAAYDTAKAAYDQYLLDQAAYEAAVVAYNQYALDKVAYDEAKAAYDVYAAAKAEYDTKKAAYDAYVTAKAEYDTKKAAYDKYVADKAAYDEAKAAFDAYKAAQEDYTEDAPAYVANTDVFAPFATAPANHIVEFATTGRTSFFNIPGTYDEEADAYETVRVTTGDKTVFVVVAKDGVGVRVGKTASTKQSVACEYNLKKVNSAKALAVSDELVVIAAPDQNFSAFSAKTADAWGTNPKAAVLSGGVYYVYLNDSYIDEYVDEETGDTVYAVYGVLDLRNKKVVDFETTVDVSNANPGDVLYRDKYDDVHASTSGSVASIFTGDFAKITYQGAWQGINGTGRTRVEWTGMNAVKFLDAETIVMKNSTAKYNLTEAQAVTVDGRALTVNLSTVDVEEYDFSRMVLATPIARFVEVAGVVTETETAAYAKYLAEGIALIDTTVAGAADGQEYYYVAFELTDETFTNFTEPTAGVFNQFMIDNAGAKLLVPAFGDDDYTDVEEVYYVCSASSILDLEKSNKVTLPVCNTLVDDIADVFVK